MLNEKQLMALDDTHRMLRDVVHGHSYQLQSWGDEILKVLSDLADARLARQRDRARCKRAGKVAFHWREDALTGAAVCKGYTKMYMDEAIAHERDRRRLRRVLGMAKGERIKVALLVDAARALLDDVMERYPDIRDIGFKCPYMEGLYEAVECLSGDAVYVLTRFRAIVGKREAARRWSAAWKAAAKEWRGAFNIRREALVALSKQRDELRRQVEQDTFCAYCGHKYPRSTPKFGNELLTEHIRQCPKHPMRKLEQRLKEAREVMQEDEAPREMLRQLSVVLREGE